MPTFPGSDEPPEREARVTKTRRQVAATVDGDHAGGVRERREAREQLGLDGLAGDQQVHRLDPGCLRGLDEILAFDREEPRLVAVLPLPEELPDELQRLVVAAR